ncbi:MAG TPA: hypothetical protein VFP65_09980 [Anaeromyxobacteraceae bacterium]|nr:hypothetical protein [Anaeromyxobacteraceae bacterium]
MIRRTFWVAVLAALAVGLLVGYAVRARRVPSFEERADEVQKDLRKSLDKITR